MTKANTVEIAEIILEDYQIIFYGQNFYIYKEGCYRLVNELKIAEIVKDFLLDDFSSHRLSEVITYLKISCFKEETIVDNTLFLNVKNGLLNLKTFDLISHYPELYSTIQLNVNYDENAKCENWKAALDQIFENDHKKIALLQEYFGLCLTTDTKFEKSLFLIGEGANGKSVVLFVLQKILGESNYSAIPLEQFNNPNYIANLFGKLSNISIETNAKASVYDSTFKAIVSGDSLTADSKFKHPFTFRAFCKLIFALNNMPRVDDKTSAFFRRLLILRFNKIFQETEQNKNLKFELLNELDGIFYWMIQGLQRLRLRGYFELPDEMKREIDEYKKENNNVILFIEDKCEFNISFEISKGHLYLNYSLWCKENNNHPLSKSKFGKELKRIYLGKIVEPRNEVSRNWGGIRLSL